ncbi:unnamed protein product [Kuraishia capsulata CBS 1993]|uniref:non-specific serine/threonine protein kinase n=1 Tax=Kuraishia capsulata CBS 1993 TaxID=1382522 RepID=W6MG94_9ASCO|nr:uncharacterized protein KUCA_T00000757001 [Kuraishia capsulata CBS 1993]CDK24791.1 unnamed protein product [Kuraishia capsulata CBS 1993]
MTTSTIAAQAAMNLHRKVPPREVDMVAECVAKANNRLSQSSTNTTNSYKRRSQNHVGPWRLGRTLGKGASGRVRLAKHTQTGQLSAVKIVPKSVISNGNNSKQNTERDSNGLAYGIEREIIIMKLISHPHVMGLYDVWENKGELYLVLEYIEGGELFDYLIRKGRLDEKEAVKYFKQIISGVNYCHHFNICHRDLKPENLLLDKNHNIKIADFGMAALETKGKLLETSCGSPHYASPEIVAGKHYHGGPSDIWSCGVILFALLTGHLPFDDTVIRNLLLKVQSGKFRMPQYLSAEAKDLIWAMLKVNPSERIKMKDILKHPLLKKYSTKEDQILDKFNHPESLDASPITDIDKDILLNLQTLWRGTDMTDIRNKLREQGLNSQKIFYRLLQKYRDEHASGTGTTNNSSKKRIPRSASIVTTIIHDENGGHSKTVKEVVVPSESRRPIKKRSKNSLNVEHGLPSKQSSKVIPASSSSKKPVSFKGKSISSHSLVSKKSIQSMRGSVKPPSRDLPKLPELSDFQYLCDEIFGKQSATGFKIFQDEEEPVSKPEILRPEQEIRKLQPNTMKISMDKPAVKELHKKPSLLAATRGQGAKQGLNTYVSSLDPRSSSKPTVNRNTSDVLKKFGVRMSRLDLDESEFGDKLGGLPKSSTFKRSMVVSRSTSTRKLNTLINQRDMSVDDYNRTKDVDSGHNDSTNMSVDYESFTFLSAKQVPIILPQDKLTGPSIDERFADVDEDETILDRESQSNSSEIRHHRKVESVSTAASAVEIQPFPVAPQVDEDVRKSKRIQSRKVRESFQSENRLSRFAYLGSFIDEVEVESVASMFADPDEEYEDIHYDEDSNRMKFLQIAQKMSGESGDEEDTEHIDKDIQANEQEEGEVADKVDELVGRPKPDLPQTDLRRRSTILKTKDRILSLVPKREAPELPSPAKKISWIAKLFTFHAEGAPTVTFSGQMTFESQKDSAALTQVMVDELQKKQRQGLVKNLHIDREYGVFTGSIPSKYAYGRALKFKATISDEMNRSTVTVEKIKGSDKMFKSLLDRVRVIC